MGNKSFGRTSVKQHGTLWLITGQWQPLPPKMSPLTLKVLSCCYQALIAVGNPTGQLWMWLTGDSSNHTKHVKHFLWGPVPDVKNQINRNGFWERTILDVRLHNCIINFLIHFLARQQSLGITPNHEILTVWFSARSCFTLHLWLSPVKCLISRNTIKQCWKHNF